VTPKLGLPDVILELKEEKPTMLSDAGIMSSCALTPLLYYFQV